MKKHVLLLVNGQNGEHVQNLVGEEQGPKQENVSTEEIHREIHVIKIWLRQRNVMKIPVPSGPSGQIGHLVL